MAEHLSLVVAAIDRRLVLNTHLAWTPEFTVTLADGRSGRGSAPRGETLSIYEDRVVPELATLDEVRKQLLGRPLTQAGFDEVLRSQRQRWGRGATYALSMAFFYATQDSKAAVKSPRLLFNVLNGGLHAYTNPVASDFYEYMLLPTGHDLRASIDAYRAILVETAAALAKRPRRKVGNNEVHDLGSEINRSAIEFLQSVLQQLGLENEFSLMIDGSAGDFWSDGRYRLSVSERVLTSAELVAYWGELIRDYGLGIIEDPLAEQDLVSWRRLRAAAPSTCRLFGDNLTAADPARLSGKEGIIDGVLVKPDQAGTVSDAAEFVATARKAGLQVAASHRSIESDSLFLIDFVLSMQIEMIKIGPFRDFSAVAKTNELLRRMPGT